MMRNGELAQITKDDTFVQTLVDEGRITAEEAPAIRSGRLSCAL